MSGMDAAVVGVGNTAENTREVQRAQSDRIIQNTSNANLVRQHEEEVLQQVFRNRIVMFLCSLCILSVLNIVVLIILIVVAAGASKRCDVPLRNWVWIIVGLACYGVAGGLQKDLAQAVCCWHPDPNVPQPLHTLPLRVRLFYLMGPLLNIVWSIIGLVLVAMSGQVTSEYPTCGDVAPGLLKLSAVYAVVNIIWQAFLFLAQIGFARFLGALMRAGALQSIQHAAPKGSMEKNTEVIQLGHPALKDEPTCCICLMEWSDKQAMVKTRVCGHVFHHKCLEGWLKVNRNCPLCREDLGISPGKAAV